MTNGLANLRFPRVTADYVVCWSRDFFLRHSLFDIRYSQYTHRFGLS